ncbi:MAG: phenylacetate-CoA oxygenase subunit PaaC [Alphaproteobacteria bacterium]|nr:phenylacetate-CoA oxygenase subunit PaaC [Alphaproteobacteria bacterium]
MPDTAHFEFLLRLGDSCLVLGHRLSEWCGHAPELEEDIALANVALDLTGQADMLLAEAARFEGKGRDADALAFLRDAGDFRNLLICERPNGDFAHTIMRQFLFDAWQVELYGALAASSDKALAGIAGKAVKEAEYHLRHSGEWVVRLGDGTPESHSRAQDALDLLWPYTGEMFEADETVAALVAARIAPDPAALQSAWTRTVDDVLAEATLAKPPSGWMQTGGLTGRHSEALGHMLAVMQVLPRSHPGAKW